MPNRASGEKMILSRGKIRLRLAAAGACVALMLGLLLPTVKLLLPEPVTCGMACCLDSGECCCLVAWSEADEHGHEELTISSQMEMRNGCPPNCAAAPSASPIFTPKSDRAFAHYFVPRLLQKRQYGWRIVHVACQVRASFSPRAPPALFL